MIINVAQVVQACSGPVAPATMAAIIATESSGNPWAIYVNGLGPAGSMRFPNKQAAIAAATHYMRQGYKVDMGLAQVDSENLGMLHLTVRQAFNPCTNVSAGAAIMAGAYIQALRAGYPAGVQALTHGFEAYNSGQTTGDYSYAQTVWRHAGVLSHVRLPTHIQNNGSAKYTVNVDTKGVKLPVSPFLSAISVVYPAPPVADPVVDTITAQCFRTQKVNTFNGLISFP
jgi:type IV secretion system protein VirB1